MDIEELARRVERLESEQAIRRVAHDYCVGADQRDAGRWLGAWTPDAVWQVSADRAMSGQAEILTGVQRQWESFPQMQHGTVNHTIDLDPDDPDRAGGRSDVVLHVQRTDGTWVTGGGTYLDEYLRVDGCWRIARRTVHRPFDLAPLAPGAGPIVLDDDTA